MFSLNGFKFRRTNNDMIPVFQAATKIVQKFDDLSKRKTEYRN